MVRTSAADFVRRQIDDAVAAGAKALIDESEFAAKNADGVDGAWKSYAGVCESILSLRH